MTRDLAVARSLAERVRPSRLARDQRMGVLPAFASLLPEGLPRGSVVAVSAVAGVAGATALALALAAGPSQDGAWVAVVGAPSLGLVAAAESGVAPDRLVLVDLEAGGNYRQLASVVAALVDGFDVVLVGPAARIRLRPRDTRRLEARGRERGAVLLGVGGDLPGGSAQIRLTVTAGVWEGVEQGAGHLQSRQATVECAGRGAASRPRIAELLLPGPLGPARATRLSSALGEAASPQEQATPPKPRRIDVDSRDGNEPSEARQSLVTLPEPA